jgi:hypothetical protein
MICLPTLELRQVRQGAIPHDGAILRNLLDKLAHMLALDVMDAAAFPLRHNKIVQDVSGLPLRGGRSVSSEQIRWQRRDELGFEGAEQQRYGGP